MTSGSVGLGIDLGSSAVRVGLFDYETDELIKTESHPVAYERSVGGNWEYTQRTVDIIEGIVRCLTKLSVEKYTVQCCGVAATCSMATFRTKPDGTLIPYPDNNNVVFWMDSTAKVECDLLNEIIDSDIKDHMGGTFIPEMGVPKLLKLMKLVAIDTSVSSDELVVYDLHRYILWAISAKFKWNGKSVDSNRNINGIGIDGEIGGWSSRFYNILNSLISSGYKRIKINEFNFQDFPTETATSLVSAIDSYASWFSVISKSIENSLFMVAGTSTCYIYSPKSPQSTIKGMWGPFTNVLAGKWNNICYAGGHSCTGKLLENLFLTHPAVPRRDNKSQTDLINEIESRILEIENKQNCSIHVLTKHMHYYGDLEGNRTPFVDPLLRGMSIGESTDFSFDNLVYRYVIILEFLAFQTKLIVDTFLSNIAHYEIEKFSLTITGSQAKNHRLLSLIKVLVDDIVVKIPKGDVSLMGVNGMYKISKLNKEDYSVDVLSIESESFMPLEEYNNNKYIKALLLQKFDINVDMVNVQQKYRHLMESVKLDINN
ncbi:Protein MPA43 [Nakaseomyces bracarensis]|uniref:Protein MPA43 n=1 Tax=Nakaseomyces bracarensis TaxID=273131 RepID=A0ABR4NYB2_9SACH